MPALVQVAAWVICHSLQTWVWIVSGGVVSTGSVAIESGSSGTVSGGAVSGSLESGGFVSGSTMSTDVSGLLVSTGRGSFESQATKKMSKIDRSVAKRNVFFMIAPFYVVKISPYIIPQKVIYVKFQTEKAGRSKLQKLFAMLGFSLIQV